MISFSTLSKRPGATLAGIFGVALSSVVLLCGAGSVPVENFLPQGAMQGDLNAGGHNLTNAATVSATNVVVTGTLTAPSGFTLPFSQIATTPTSLGGYGITDPIVLTTGTYSNPTWVTALAASKLTGALPAISGGALTGIPYGSLTGTPALGSLAALSPTGTADSSHYLRGDDAWASLGSGVAAALGDAVDASGGVLTFGGLGTVTQAHSANLDAVAAGASANPGYVLTANSDGSVSFQAGGGGGGGVTALDANFLTLASITTGTLELNAAPGAANGLVVLDGSGALDFPGTTTKMADGANGGMVYGPDGSPVIGQVAGEDVFFYPYVGSSPFASSNSLYYSSGIPLTNGYALYDPLGNQLADNSGNLYYPGGTAVLATTTILKASDNSFVADNAGNRYYGNDAILADVSGNLYYGDGSTLLADASGSVHGNGSNLTGILYAGSFSGTGTATTSFVVTIGNTMANTTYKVNVTPTAALSAAVFYISAKTTTTFTVTYLAGLTGTVSFDWSVFP